MKFLSPLLFTSFFLSSFLLVAQVEIIPNYGNVNGFRLSVENYVETESIEDVHLVYGYWEDDNIVYLMSDEGEILKEIPLSTDSTRFTPSLYSNEEFFFLIGYEAVAPFGISEEDLLARKWKIQQYDLEGNLVFERKTPVNSQDIGLLYSEELLGITTEVVSNTNLSNIGTVTSQYCAQIVQTRTFDPITLEIGIGPIISYRYDRLTDNFESLVLDSTFNGITDMIGRDTLLQFYGVRGVDIASASTTHFFGEDISDIQSVLEPNVYGGSGLSMYAETNDTNIFEVKATANAITTVIMEDLILTQKDLDNNVIDSKLVAIKRAPYGKYSLEIGKQESLYILSADVTQPLLVDQWLEKINISDLNIDWSINLDRTIFGKVQTIVPLDNSCLVFGTLPTEMGSNLVVTRINDMSTSVSNQPKNQDLFIGPNPFSDHIYLSSTIDDGFIQIYDLNGRLIQEKSITANQIYLDIPSGFYLIILYDAQGNILQYKKATCIHQ